MADTHTLPHIHNLPPRYYQYVATQSRVSDWVSQTHSTHRDGRKTHSRRGSKDTIGKQSTSSAHTSTYSKRPPTSRKASKDDTFLASRGVEIDPLPPAIALVSSSLVICAFLPSLLAVSAFVALLTWASIESEAKSRETEAQWVPGAEK